MCCCFQMRFSSLFKSGVCPLQYLIRHIKASCSDSNYASWISPIILIVRSAESVWSYVNCSIRSAVEISPRSLSPCLTFFFFFFLRDKIMNYATGLAWKRCKFVFSASVRAANVNSFTLIHFSTTSWLSHTPASAYAPTHLHAHTV